MHISTTKTNKTSLTELELKILNFMFSFIRVGSWPLPAFKKDHGINSEKKRSHKQRDRRERKEEERKTWVNWPAFFRWGSAFFYSSPELTTVTGEQVPAQGLPQTPSPPSLKGQWLEHQREWTHINYCRRTIFPPSLMKVLVKTANVIENKTFPKWDDVYIVIMSQDPHRIK